MQSSETFAVDSQFPVDCNAFARVIWRTVPAILQSETYAGGEDECSHWLQGPAYNLPLAK